MNSYIQRTVRIVAIANLAYFAVEFLVARSIGSVSLFADSIDFLEDASVNALILLALEWPPARRALMGKALAGVLLIPSLATIWTAWMKFGSPIAPSAALLSIAGVGALVVNLSCALLLARYRRQGGSLTRAAFLSARNDAFANVAIIAAGSLTAYAPSAWPDLVVGIGIAILNADAASQVYSAARDEHLDDAVA